MRAMRKRWSYLRRVVVSLTGLATLVALVSGCALPFGQTSVSGASSATASTTTTVPTATPSAISALYVANSAGSLSAFTPATGHPLWSVNTGAVAIASGPLMDGEDQGILFLTARQPNAAHPDEGHVYAISLSGRQALWSTHLVVSFLAARAGVVYVSDATGIAALNATNDARYWHYSTPQAYPMAFAIANGVIYLSYIQDSAHAYLDAISAGDGARLWRRALQGVTPGSITVSGGRAYVVSSGSGGFARLLETFDATSGAPGWVSRFETAVLDITVAGNVVYAHTSGPDMSGSLVALNATTGARLFTPGAQSGCYIASPALSGSMFYTGCSKLGKGASSVDAFNAQTGALVWQRDVSGDTVAVSALDGNVVYAVGVSESGGETITTALNATSGATLWRQGGTCVAAAGGIAFLTSNSSIIAIKGATGAEIWSLGGVGNTPALLAA